MAESAVELKGSRILVVDDTPANLKLMSRAMAGAGYEAMVASSGEVALQLAERFVPDLVLLDVTMPGLDGFEVCRRLKQDEATRAIPVIFLTARDETTDLLEGFRAGGVDYVTKPFQKEEVLVRIQTHLEKAALVRTLAEKNAALEARTRQLEEEISRREALTQERDALAGRLEDLSQQQIAQQGGSLVGQSLAVAAMQEEIALLQQAHSVSVLITGESGTGKEVVARAIHYGGSRARGPFVAVNCAAIPRELAESSFFGHLRGAFTGAHEARRGYFEQADGGTLFLDEIGDLPLELQAKLLRTLETGTVTPLGGSQERAVDVRILAATNQELTTLIARDRFREDLYFRLAGFTVAVPPLRNRREDIPLLVDHFLRRYAAEMGREPAGSRAGPGAGTSALPALRPPGQRRGADPGLCAGTRQHRQQRVPRPVGGQPGAGQVSAAKAQRSRRTGVGRDWPLEALPPAIGLALPGIYRESTGNLPGISLAEDPAPGSRRHPRRQCRFFLCRSIPSPDPGGHLRLTP
ncbi:MAG: sigma-54-dependent Fis family transcriptional regulator [Candidatus Latescibacteria bacterium]|nr:sigma-54-dependent Fis family transcriptional regulator [Candidatus Latescibacterota bacterium]